MTGIPDPIEIDSRHTAKHLPNTPQSQRFLRRGLAAHLFLDFATMERVATAIIEQGEYLGEIRGYKRYGMLFTEPIGHRLSPNLHRTPLYYGELKIDSNNRYHVIPRTRPSRT